jgi:hypothetical protein
VKESSTNCRGPSKSLLDYVIRQFHLIFGPANPHPLLQLKTFVSFSIGLKRADGRNVLDALLPVDETIMKTVARANSDRGLRDA